MDPSTAPGSAEQIVAATGVPVLRRPSRPPREFGHVVLLGWNGRREAARAAHDALRFPRAAKRAKSCAFGEHAAASLDDAAATLGRHDVSVRPERAKGADAQAGEVLLAEAWRMRRICW